MIRLEDKGRQYKRYRPSSEEKNILADKGMQWVLSSNVSAIGIDGDDLIIRFINGSLYQYSKMADSKNSILNSNSKGHWVWVNLRRRNVPYKKIGRMPLKSDTPMSDEDLFENIRTEAIRVEEPQLLDERDIMIEPNVIKKSNILNLAASIIVLNDLPGIKLLPVNILDNLRQM